MALPIHTSGSVYTICVLYLLLSLSSHQTAAIVARYVADLRERHLEYWTPYSETHPREHNSKHSTYHQWCALLPIRRDLVTHSPYILPKYMLLNLPRDVIRSIARSRPCVYTLRFETATEIKVIPPPVTCAMLIMSKMSRMFCSTVPIPT